MQEVIIQNCTLQLFQDFQSEKKKHCKVSAHTFTSPQENIAFNSTLCDSSYYFQGQILPKVERCMFLAQIGLSTISISSFIYAIFLLNLSPQKHINEVQSAQPRMDLHIKVYSLICTA